MIHRFSGVLTLSFEDKSSPDNPSSPSFCVANASLTPHSGLVAEPSLDKYNHQSYP